MGSSEERPLAGLHVLDLSRVLAGPYCAMLLGDLGAEVIKVEEPTRGDDTRAWGPPYVGGESAYYLSLNRNKRGMTLNLKHPEALSVFDRLVERSDVLIQNFKAGTLERLGRGDDALERLNPRLVRLAISGFGSDGPYRDRPAYDFVLQAMVGLMSITGEPEGEPMRLGVAVVDVVTALYGALGVLGALQARERTGRGQRVDTSLLESGVAMLVNVAGNYLNSGKAPTRHGNAHANIVPYQTFRAANGYIVIAIGNDGQFAKLCELLPAPQLVADPRYATNQARVANRAELVPILQDYFSRHTVGHWTDLLIGAGLPCGPINTVDQVFRDPQVLARRMVQRVAHPTAGEIGTVGVPFQFSETPAGIDRPPPLLGEHSDAILTEIGFLPEQIAHFRAEGVI
jgi:glutaryl-CoA transferase